MAKHKYIETPGKMWELFQAYCTHIKANPFKLVEQKKGNVIIPKNYDGNLGDALNATVELPLQRPLTMEGFENYLFTNNIITDVSDYFENKDKRYEDYIPICRAIKRTIRQDQIEGGMAGIYNPSITQRLNGLTEKIQEDGTKELNIKVKYERKGTDSHPE